MKNLIPILLLVFGALKVTGGIYPSNPEKEEIGDFFNLHSWKLEITESKEIEAIIEFRDYVKIIDKKFGIKNLERDTTKQTFYIFISPEVFGSNYIQESKEGLLSSSGGREILPQNFTNDFEKFEKIELPEEIEFGMEYPIMKTKYGNPFVFVTIKQNRYANKTAERNAE